MSMEIFDVAASGMMAQRVKLDTIASNIANINTTRQPDGSKIPYIKKNVSFRALYEDSFSRGPANFSANSANARFDPSTGKMLIHSGVALNQGTVAQGVEVDAIYEESRNAIKTVYDPSHPDADENGYVDLPNINIVEEMVGMVAASKAYEANATVAENVKTMINSALEI